MSAVNACDRLQAFGRSRPDLGLEQCASVLRAGPAVTATFDYDYAIAMFRACPRLQEIQSGTRTERLRETTLALVLVTNPPWKWLIPLGRRRLAEFLTPDAKQVFDSAGLYAGSDYLAVRLWWDSLAQMIRTTSGESHLQTGRTGEDLTMAHETRVLAEAGRPDLHPEFVGFEDTTLGYDVRSFIVTGDVVRPKYIEVKATEIRPLRFSLTSTQWATAQRLRSMYFVHLWHLPTKELIEISFAELSSSIPENRGSGNWETTIISWDQARTFG
jgi:hypothetical protein